MHLKSNQQNCSLTDKLAYLSLNLPIFFQLICIYITIVSDRITLLLVENS